MYNPCYLHPSCQIRETARRTSFLVSLDYKEDSAFLHLSEYCGRLDPPKEAWGTRACSSTWPDFPQIFRCRLEVVEDLWFLLWETRLRLRQYHRWARPRGGSWGKCRILRRIQTTHPRGHGTKDAFALLRGVFVRNRVQAALVSLPQSQIHRSNLTDQFSHQTSRREIAL